MNSISTLSLILAILLFTIGALLFVRFFPWPNKLQFLKMVIVMDVNDYSAFDAIMAILKEYDMADASYEEDSTTSRIDIWIPKESYEPIYKSIKTLQNVEVI